MRKSDAHKMFEEERFNQTQREIPFGMNAEGKPNRVSISLGVFNDGLRGSFSKILQSIVNVYFLHI